MLSLLLTSLGLARCPDPDAITLSILLPHDTAAGSAGAGTSMHGDAVFVATAGPQAQALQGQVGVCGWTLRAEAHGDFWGDSGWSAAAGATRGRRWGSVHANLTGLIGAQEASPMLAARARVSRPSVRLTPYLQAEGRQVFLPSTVGWGWRGELGLTWGLRDAVGVGAAAFASPGTWGGQASLIIKPSLR